MMPLLHTYGSQNTYVLTCLCTLINLHMSSDTVLAIQWLPMPFLAATGQQELDHNCRAHLRLPTYCFY
jgi:hypothetical protein